MLSAQAVSNTWGLLCRLRQWLAFTGILFRDDRLQLPCYRLKWLWVLGDLCVSHDIQSGRFKAEARFGARVNAPSYHHLSAAARADWAADQLLRDYPS
jgi:hypothetical protein